MKTRAVLFFVAFVIMFAGACATAHAQQPANVPMPPGLRVLSPGNDVPAELAEFSGKWYGVWDNILEHVLVVKEVTPTHVVVVYAVGTAPAWNIHQPRWYEVNAEFVDKALVVKFPRIQVTVTYKMNKDGMLSGTYESARGASRATLKQLLEVSPTAKK